MENKLFEAKAALTALCGAFSVAFGWQGWLVLAWVACMAGDYISGSAAACKGGRWSSAAAREGLWHKTGMIFAVGVAALAEMVLTQSLANLPGVELPFTYPGGLFPLTLCWYILTELGSILENAHALGAPLPEFLKKVLEKCKIGIEPFEK